MSKVIQKQGVASGLFSSALFCLWLSSASLMVWVDFGRSPAEQVAAAAPAPARSTPRVAAASTDAIQHH